MGTIVAAALVSHVPPLAMPAERRISPEGEDTDLIEGFVRMRAKLDEVNPDVLVIVDSHWFTTIEHVVAGAPRHRGILTSEELPSLIKGVEYDYPGAAELGVACEEAGVRRKNFHSIGNRPQIVNVVDEHLPHHYSTINVVKHLRRDEKILAASVCQTAKPPNFMEFGATIRDAIDRADCRVAILGSGAMSHRLHSFDRIVSPLSLSYRPEGISSREAYEYDMRVLDLWKRGRHVDVLERYPDYMRFFPEAWFGHYLIMLGALGGAGFTGVGRPMSRYENQVGTGNIHVWFDLPEVQ
jgi:3,4-dihydroxyphenylacetate 2,3-dioxygenase